MAALKKKRSFLLFITTFLLLVFQADRPASSFAPQSSEQIQVVTILSKVREYCRRLEKGAYDFICLEEISEKIDHSRDNLYRIGERNKYIYDYQLIKKEGAIKENRILLEKNGYKTRQENAPLETKVFRHQFVLIRTADLFNEFSASLNDYRLIGEDILYGEEAIVLEAVPKPLYEQRFLYGTEPSYLLGKIWIKKKDYSILKIIWNPKVIRDFNNIEELAIKFKAEPRVTTISEYGIEKNGIRFPSRLYIQEAYINKAGKKFIRSQTEILYKNYQFFTVETEVRFDKAQPA